MILNLNFITDQYTAQENLQQKKLYTNKNIKSKICSYINIRIAKDCYRSIVENVHNINYVSS